MSDQQQKENPSQQPDKEQVAEVAREMKKRNDQSYWAIVRRQFRKNRTAVWSVRIIIALVLIGLLADILANEKPLYCKYEGEIYFPVLKDYAVGMGLSQWPGELAMADWKSLELESAVWAPIPWGQSETDKKHAQYVGPSDRQRQIFAKAGGTFTVETLPESKKLTINYDNGDTKVYHLPRIKKIQFEEGERFEEGELLVDGLPSNRWRHWLGTDEIGRDIFSGMVHGTRIAMLVGVVSMSISTLIGILLGALAGYFGDSRLKMSRIRLILNLLFLFFAWFYAFYVNRYNISDAFNSGAGAAAFEIIKAILIFGGIMAIPNLLSMVLKKVPALAKKVAIPVDILVSRFIEVIISIPKLLLILVVVAVAEDSSIMLVMLVIGATSWTGIARFMRGELLRVRSLEYVEAAQALGYSEARIIFRHAIPNSLTPVLIAVAFGIAGAILIESSLSFLGIGVKADVITWGKLLSLAREAPEAWWLAIFPGFAIFITVTVFNLVGEGLTDALDPRLKQ